MGQKKIEHIYCTARDGFTVFFLACNYNFTCSYIDKLLIKMDLIVLSSVTLGFEIFLHFLFQWTESWALYYYCEKSWILALV